jgi:hypothetical protein
MEGSRGDGIERRGEWRWINGLGCVFEKGEV